MTKEEYKQKLKESFQTDATDGMKLDKWLKDLWQKKDEKNKQKEKQKLQNTPVTNTRCLPMERW